MRAGLTTGEMAQVTGVPQQTLIAWDRAGVLKATRPGKRSSARAPRLYDLDAIVAAYFAGSLAGMGFKGDDFKELVALMQAGDASRLELSAIVTTRDAPGLMTHRFVRDTSAQTVGAWLDRVRENGGLIEGPTSLWTIREHFLPLAEQMLEFGPELMVGGSND